MVVAVIALPVHPEVVKNDPPEALKLTDRALVNVIVAFDEFNEVNEKAPRQRAVAPKVAPAKRKAFGLGSTETEAEDELCELEEEIELEDEESDPEDEEEAATVIVLSLGFESMTSGSEMAQPPPLKTEIAQSKFKM